VSANPYALPEGAEPAPRLSRFVAWFLDSVIVGFMTWVPATIVAAATGAFAQFSIPESDFDFSVFRLPLFVCAVGFFAWAWITTLLVARYGQTIAKRLLEIRVVRTDGSQASLGRIFWLRNVVNALLKIVPLYGLVDALLIFGERRQCIHDMIADTIVVKA